MVKMKRSAAKCMKVDTPELELPMFDNTFRFANAMARSPRRGQGSGFKNIMETFMKMQMFSQMMDSGDSPSNFISVSPHLNSALKYPNVLQSASSYRSAPPMRTPTTSETSCTRSWSTRRRRCTTCTAT